MAIDDEGSSGTGPHGGFGGGGPSSGRIPPHNLDAEESLLGAMLLTREAIATSVEMVRPEHFYKPAHAHVYDAITTLYGAGASVDIVTVAEELERAGVLEMIGGRATLVAIQSATPATSNAGRYARIVEELAVLRRLIVTGGEIVDLGYSRPEDVVKTVDQAEAMMFEVAQHRAEETTSPVSELLNENLDRLEQLYERGDAITGTPTGFADLDKLTAGLQPSSLVVIGARPAMGKTSFALSMAAYAALEKQRPCLFFSLEMSRQEISQRLLFGEARVDASKARVGQLSESDWAKISVAVGKLAESRLWIDDNPNTTVMEIRSKARKLKSQVGDLGMVVIDYIQLMSSHSAVESRQVEVADISRNLKILARELETPVIALAQLNRGLEARADKRPMLADLRESGSLEQDADIVGFIYRDEVYNPDSPDQGIAEISISKHRAGPTGTVRLAFLKQYTRFVDMAREG